jgi:hypothetical protein
MAGDVIMKTIKLSSKITVLMCGLLVGTMAFAANGPVVVGDITINVVDPDPSIGFSDPSPADPASTAGGNPGTTIGEQRLEAYKHVAGIWNGNLNIKVQIVLQASFAALSCDATGGVLGSAGALNVFRDFPGPSFPNTWYGAALANNLAGFDLNGSEPDPGLLAPPFNDEIVTFFNANLGKPGCLENSAWYYGFDNNPPPGAIDFIEVLTHEVGHGVGFQDFGSETTGQFFLGFPDQWSRFLGDNLIGKRWDQMIDFERSFSAANGPNLVWNGPNVTTAAPTELGPAQILLVTGPVDVAGIELPFGTASFGPALPPGGIQGTVELVNDGVATATDGCEALVGFTPGNIALIDRGGCTFVLKAQNAEAAGASAVIIANNVPGATPPGLGGSGPVGITAVSVTLDGGQVLREFPGTTVDIGQAASDGSLAGTDPVGRLKMYAPGVVAPGSSVAHYDVSAFPNVLMEPFNTNDVDVNAGDVDLTDDLLRDIGWDDQITCPINADSRPTVIVGSCDSGVENRRGEYVVFPSGKWLFPGTRSGAFGTVAGGCYIADLLAACSSPFVAPNDGQYQSCISQLTNDMLAQGVIGPGEQGAIKSCASN